MQLDRAELETFMQPDGAVQWDKTELAAADNHSWGQSDQVWDIWKKHQPIHQEANRHANHSWSD